MLDIERSSEILRVRSDRVELSFRHDCDRWRHEFSAYAADQWWTVLRSLEGSAENPMPASPALQDLRLEQLSEQVFEFQGMGQAGSAIYSAAIRLDFAVLEVAFDLCVRGKRAGSSMRAQSHYEISSGSAVPDSNGSAVTLSDSGARLTISPIRIEGQPDCECRLLDSATRQIAAGCFSADAYSADPKPRSIRWGYRFSLAGLP